MMQLIGESPEEAAAHGKAIMTLETELAKASMDRVSRRDPNAVFHKMTVAQLAGLCPLVDWNAYIAGMGAPGVDSLNVNVPDFYTALDKTLNAASLDTLKAYMKWHILHRWADQLSTPFVRESFEF